MSTWAADPGAVDTDVQRRTNDRTWVRMYLVLVGVSLFLGLVAFGTAPKPLALPLVMLMLACPLVAVRPVAGIYLIGFFTLFSDGAVSPWYPFTKNMSSSESIMFLGNGAFISPLEVILGITFVVWLLRLLLDRTSPRLVKAALFWPALAVTGFLLVGFVYGVGTGGDRYIAIWEMRPIFYLPIFYVLVTNLFTNRRQYHRLGATMAVALVIHSLLALLYLMTLSAVEREELESVLSHSSAVQMGVVVAVPLAAWLLPKAPRSMRWLMLLAAVPVGLVFLISQRRAAIVALAVAMLVLGILMTKLNPKLLRRLGPILAVMTVLYLGAFWNAEGLMGFPAQALKTAIAPNEVGSKDQSSDGYRQVENLDLLATIQAKPVTGLGFGHQFYRPYPLPDISFFPFYQYMPHNSVLWVWIQTGVGGFIAMLFLFASGIRQGVRSMLKLPPGGDTVLVFAGLSFVIMYLVFAYVDVAWDARSMITLAVSMAVCSEILRLPADEPHVPRSKPSRLHATVAGRPERRLTAVTP